jgi:hypothetical protein
MSPYPIPIYAETPRRRLVDTVAAAGALGAAGGLRPRRCPAMPCDVWASGATGRVMASGRVDAEPSDPELVLFPQQRKGLVHLKIPM